MKKKKFEMNPKYSRFKINGTSEVVGLSLSQERSKVQKADKYPIFLSLDNPLPQYTDLEIETIEN